MRCLMVIGLDPALVLEAWSMAEKDGEHVWVFPQVWLPFRLGVPLAGR